MKKRPLLFCGGFLGIGILWTNKEELLLLIIAAFLLTALMLYKKNIFPLLCILCLLIGTFRVRQVEQLEMQVHKLDNNQNITLIGTLYKTEVKNQKEYLYLKNVNLKDSQKIKKINSILVISNIHVNSRMGNLIKVSGKYKKWNTAKNPGAFDEALYYHMLNINGKVILEQYSVIDNSVDEIGEWLANIRKKTACSYEKLCSSENAAVLCAMVLGDTSKLKDDIKEIYQDAGVLHILAISGQHISLIGMACFKILRKMKLGILVSGLCSAGIVICYGILTGSGVSTIRAVFMFLVFMGAQVLGRTFDMLSATALSAILMLLDNPFVLWQGAFLLTYGAVIIIALMEKLEFFEQQSMKKSGKEIDNQKKKPGQKILYSLKKCLWSSFFIQTGIIPIIAYFYYETARYAVFTNLFVLFLATVMLQLGILGGITGNLCMPLGKLILNFCSVIIYMIESICKFFQQLPFEQWIIGRPQVWQIVIYYILFCFFMWSSTWWRYKLLKWITLIGLSIIMSGVLGFKVDRGIEITSLFVGQGDGIYFRGPQGKNYFIDGGSSDLKKVGKQQILPFLKSQGICQIDYWFVSHTDEDHISGLKEILEDNYPVKYLFLPKVGIRNQEYENLIKMAERSGTKVILIEKGDVLEEKNGEEKMLLRCLYPSYESSIKQESMNENSLVLSLEYAGLKCLFTGDIDFEGEEELEKITNLSEYQVLKVAHHGSKNSTSEKFLNRIKPKLSIISCGENNFYGHPHKQLLKRLNLIESKIHITSKEGAIFIRIFTTDLEKNKRQTKMIVEKFSSH